MCMSVEGEVRSKLIEPRLLRAVLVQIWLSFALFSGALVQQPRGFAWAFSYNV